VRNILEKEVPTHDEVIDIANNIKRRRTRALFVIAYLTGGRINEILPKKYILRQKLDKETGLLTKWRERIDYPGIMKKNIEFIQNKGRDFILIKMLNEKNLKQHIKRVPFPIDKEKELVFHLQSFINRLQPNDVLFPFSDVTAWSRLKRKTGFNPHFMRHMRTTHLITLYKLQDHLIVKYMGWTDARPLSKYAHLRWTDIADAM